MERRKVGEVFHYFAKIGVAAIRLTEGDLAVGDTIVIQGPSTNVTSRIETMQIEHAAVTSAARGQEVGIRVGDRVREKDLVYKVTA
ncbi:MAG: translation elongation factor-like protein [Methanobacteriota archaeon]